jgi:hypothetical protein
MAGTNLTGILHIVCGTLAIMFYAIIIGIKVPFFYLGTGIWGGFFFIVAGGIGYAAARTEQKSMYVLSLVFGIIAFLCALACCCFSAFVYYYLLNIHPDRFDYMPMFQLYLAFNSLFFIVSILDLFVSLLHMKTSFNGISESSYGPRKNVRPPSYNPDTGYQPPPRGKY